MCAISGAYSFGASGAVVDVSEICSIRDSMASRGPDGEGLWLSADRRVGLAHRRLAIIDLDDRAAQPMHEKSGRFTIVFNGEIYNYRELRQELSGVGFEFRTSSDTEVLLALFEKFGSGMLTKLRGMFALAIWDQRDRRLFLARDHYGIKPLYYACDGTTFRFASQARALVAGGKVSQEPDAAGWVGFFLHGSVPEPFTTFKAIKALPAGASMMIDGAGASEPQSYFSVADVYRAAELRRPKERDFGGLRQAITESVRYHLESDVAVGCFLSAGVDSSVLLGLMRECSGANISAVTLAFREFSGSARDESPLASIAARRFGAAHTVRIVDREEFKNDLPAVLDAMDQPSIDGINTYFVSKAASETGLKVAVSGLGGDELFGGYASFRDVPKWASLVAPFSTIPGLGRVSRIAIAAAQAVVDVGSPKIAGVLEYGGTIAGAYFLRQGLFMPWELVGILGSEFVRQGLSELAPLSRITESLVPDPGSDFGRVATLESCLYMKNQLLRDADWASMAHSVEVRVPFVDHVLLGQVASMRPRPSKSSLADITKLGLPDEIIHRPKTGFSTPLGHWMSDQRATKGGPRLSEGATSREWAKSVARRWPKENAPPMCS